MSSVKPGIYKTIISRKEGACVCFKRTNIVRVELVHTHADRQRRRA